MSTKKFKIKNGLDVDNSDIKNIGTLQGSGEILTVAELNAIATGTPTGSFFALDRADSNIMLNAFRIASNNSLTVFQMIDGIVDEYIDESGVDTGASVNQTYNSDSDYYSPAFDAEIKLLLNFDGTDGDTSTTDASSSAHTINFFGTAQLDTDEKKFGTASLLLDGDSDYLTVPDSSDWDFGTNDFTINFWHLPVTSGLNQYFFSHFQDASNYFHIYRASNDKLIIIVRIAATDLAIYQSTSALNWTNGQWHHLEIVRNGSTLLAFFNGTSVPLTASTSIGSNSISGIAGSLYIGYPGSGANYLSGSLDDFRVINGTAIHTTDFTPPTAPYTTTENMTLVSENFSAETEPNTSRITLLLEEISSFTLATDLEVAISRDGGTTFDVVTVEDVGLFDSTKKILAGSVALTSTGTNMKYRIKTFNQTDIRIHAVGLSWD